jgi:hypothetical protein
MKLQELKQLDEASYPGNLGMMEMFKFYQVATDAEKIHMKQLIANKSFDEAWEFLQKVTGVTLHPAKKSTEVAHES